jgi:glycosyltransferase involved in cell wall biosynthesis
MSKRRILFLDPVGEKGGAEVLLLQLAVRLDPDRFQPSVVCLKPGPFLEELRSAGVPARALRAHRTRHLLHVMRTIHELSCIIEGEGIDLVHGNGCTMLLYAGLAARKLRCPVVWHVHDPLQGTGLFELFFVSLQKRLRPAWTVFDTQATAENYASRYRNLTPSSVITPGIDLDLANADPSSARQRLAIPEHAPVVAMFARLQRTKGQLDLIAAAPAVLARYPETRFVICGGGLFDLEPEYHGELEQSIRTAGLQERIFVTGYLPEEHKCDLLAASTIVAHPALSEPFGLTVIEAMAAGKPVVATDCDGPKSTIVDGSTGILVPRGNPEAMADALTRLLHSPATAAAMGRSGKARVGECYSSDAMVRKFEQIYELVLNGNIPA